MRPEMTKYGLLRNLIQTKSYSGQEGNVLSQIESYLSEKGISTTTQFPIEVVEPLQQPNLIVCFQGRDRDRALIFDGHMDTVSADRESWAPLAPFGSKSGKIIDGKMYGLGASDMKSGIYAQMKIAEYINSCGVPPYDIWIAFVIEEETSGRGTSSFVNWFASQKFDYKEIGVVIPEPTDLNKFFIGQRGNLALKAKVKGETGHASQVSIDIKNSILLMAEFLRKLQHEADKWRKNYPDELFGSPTVSVTAINGGDLAYPNKLAPYCEAAIDIRTNPHFHGDAFQLVREVGENFGVVIEERWPSGPSVVGSKHSKLVSVTQEVTGLQPLIHPATTDVGWFLNNGVTQVVIYGPGHYLQSHKPGEFVKLENIDMVIEQYKTIIKKWRSDH